MFKRLIACLLTFCLVACGQASSPPATDFDTFIQESTVTLLDGTTHFNMQFLVNDCEALGVAKPTTYGVGFTTHEEYQEIMTTYQEILDELNKYDYDTLSDKQQRVYTNLKDYLSRELLLKDDYYFSNALIGSYSALQQEIPLTLSLYTIQDEEDIQGFIKDVQALDADFQDYVELEKTRQEMGLGYAQDVLDESQSQALTIAEGQGQEITQSIQAKIDLIEGMDTATKESYKQQVSQVMSEDYTQAYQHLADSLDTIQATQSETMGVSHYEGGKDYYADIVQNQLGVKATPDEIAKEISQAQDDAFQNLLQIALSYQDLIMTEDYTNIEYQEAPTPEAGLDYLKTKITGVFPSIDNLNYQVYTVPEGNRDGFAPAAYLTGKIDMGENESESIMINPDSQGNLMSTLVHEGYPGHMYQNSYLRSLDYPAIMYLTDCIGYSEGWAIYTESYTAEFLEDETEKALTMIAQAETDYTNLLLAYTDVQINQNGWTYDQFYDYLCEEIGGDVGDVKEIYDIICQTPGYYLYYVYCGYLMTSYHDEAVEKLGDQFDPISYHQAILDSGNVGLDIVKENVDAYIEANQ